jgi:imidazolonepropionase-like amidohydrolase
MATRIEADLLIPGRGEPVRDGVVVLDGSTIEYAGPAAGAPATPGAVVTRTPAVLPGLWDCHAHLTGVPVPDLGRMPLDPPALRAARATADLRAALDAGVTSVRELGGLGVHLSRAVTEGAVPGPRVYAAGAILSTTGGHADVHGLPLPWLDAFGAAGGELRLADGPAGFARAVREQLRAGAEVIKVCLSGGALSERDDPEHLQLTGAELRAVVEVAGLADRVVAAHCHGRAGIVAAVEAGIRTIEHGTFLDDDAADAMRESGTILVSTRTIVRELLAAGTAPPYAMARFAALADRHAAAVALAHSRGVPVAMGSDLLVSGPGRPGSWGRHGRELTLLAECGMSPLEVIEAATARGPDTLGPRAPRSGILAPGYDADVIAVDGDPLADLALLAEPARVTAVWQAGARVK